MAAITTTLHAVMIITLFLIAMAATASAVQCLVAVGGRTPSQPRASTIEALVYPTWVHRPQAWLALPGHLPDAMASFASVADITSGTIYTMGGVTNATTSSSIRTLQYDGRNWITLPSTLVARQYAGATIVNDTLVLVAGLNMQSSSPENLASMEYASPGGWWTAGASMKYERRCMAVVAWRGSVYALGGYNYGSMSAVEVLEDIHGSWRLLPGMPLDLTNHVAVVYKDEILVLGGYTKVQLDENQGPVAVTPTTTAMAFNGTTWRSLPPMLQPRGTFGAVVLGDYVWVVGGDSYANYTYTPIATTEYFDGEQWHRGPDLLEPRSSHGVAVVDC